MPQLDSLTFLIQIGSVFWYSWRLLVAITGKNFPQFIILPLGRKFCWVCIKSIVFVYKFSAILSLLMQFYFTLKISKLVLICLDGFDFLSPSRKSELNALSKFALSLASPSFISTFFT